MGLSLLWRMGRRPGTNRASGRRLGLCQAAWACSSTSSLLLARWRGRTGLAKPVEDHGDLAARRLAVAVGEAPVDAAWAGNRVLVGGVGGDQRLEEASDDLLWGACPFDLGVELLG